MRNKPVIVLCSANQSSAPLPALEQEIELINQHLRLSQKQELIEIERPYGRSLDAIKKVFLHRKNEVVVFHYAGHADSEIIFFPDKPAQSRGLARLLGEQQHLKLVFLNGCSTFGQLNALFGAGIKAVIATYTPIGDQKAMQFARDFYEALANDRTIKEAFGFAQAGLEAELDFKDTSDILVVKNRSLASRYQQPAELSWNLFVAEGQEEALGWQLQDGIPNKSNKWRLWLIRLGVALSLPLLVWLVIEITGRKGSEPETPVPAPFIAVKLFDPAIPDTVTQGDIFRDSAWIKNTGNLPLILRSVTSPQNWIEVIALQDTIAVQDSMLLVTSMYTESLEPGRHKGQVRIESNASSETKEIHYTLVVQKKPSVIPGPILHLPQRAVDFGNMMLGSRKRLEVPVRNTGGRSLNITVRSFQSWLQVIDFPSRIEPGREGKITLEVVATAPEGSRSGQINISSNASEGLLHIRQTVQSVFVEREGCDVGFSGVEISYEYREKSYSFTSDSLRKMDLKLPREWIEKGESVKLTFKRGTETYPERFIINGACIKLPSGFRQLIEN